jgi:RNA recognition motif-containing protein
VIVVDERLEWYRLFVGDVSNDVNERTLDTAFGKYPTYCKCKVVRDRLSLKVSEIITRHAVWKELMA